MKTNFRLPSTLLWLLSVAAISLTSPKWTFGPAAWLAPLFLLLFIQAQKPLRGSLFTCLAIYAGSLIANYPVPPFPLVLLFIIYIKAALLGTIPYLIHRLVSDRIENGISVFAFPASHVLVSYLSVWTNGGSTWGLTAYTQTEFLPLLQLASVTGIWGIHFLIHWFASTAAYCVKYSFEWNKTASTVKAFGSFFLAVLIFGTARINPFFSSPQQTVRAAGITANTLELIEVMYEDAFNQRLNPNLGQLTMSSPELAELQKGMVAYIRDPFASKFEHTRQFSRAFTDSLFQLAEREAEAGAKIISFSEALMFTVKSEENSLIRKGQILATKHSVYVVLAAAVILPGEVDGTRKWMENRCWLIGPDGSILSNMQKNRPVPMAEAGTIPGDGIVPVVNTELGNIATSICYDADFPSLMRQAGEKRAGLMVLPSGDWREIAPAHAQMAIMRAVENGFSLFRPVSFAYSVAADYHGRILATRNFYDSGAKVLTAYLPLNGTKTLYVLLGDFVVYACAFALTAIAALSYLASPRKEPASLISA
ncbi:MAG: hypothetical protein JST14_04025 [Bacteroidetes bacterium]|nr:hypothetical protein [Bacteroidota bacterium]